MDTPALLSTHARLARCPLCPFPPSSRRLRIDRSAQFELPFAVEAEALPYAVKADPKSEPPPARTAAKISASPNSKRPVWRAPKRQDSNRRPPAREVPAANRSTAQESPRGSGRGPILASARSEGGHGPGENQHLRADPGQELSCASPSRPTCSCVGQIRSQAVGFRSRTCVAICGLTLPRSFMSAVCV